MKNRSAEYTLKGFYYQFDKTIFEILNQTDEDNEITIEGIEDIDISSSIEDVAMQIKYQEKSKGTDSILRKPIMFMLEHFSIDPTNNFKYILYGHYKNNNDINTVFDLDRLKSMMKYRENKIYKNFIVDKNITDDTLRIFLKRFQLILSQSFEKHQSETLLKIKSEMGVTADEEIEFYYSNGLKVVNDLAIKEIRSSRKITKKEFKSKIDLKHILFNRWFIELKGKEKYFSLLHAKYFKNGLNTLNIERIFIINTLNNNIDCLKKTIYTIEERFYKKTKKHIASGAPYIFIKNITKKELILLKENFYHDDKICHDGVCFAGSSFKCKEIRKKSTIENNISLKIINKQIHLNEILTDIENTKKVFELYDKKPMSDNQNYISKIQIEDLTDIPKIIRGK